MHGLFFTTLVDFLEDRFGLEHVDAVLGSLELSTGGAYTSVSDYPQQELLDILSTSAGSAGISPEELMRDFGEILVRQLFLRHPEALEGASSTLDFIATVDSHIHVAVLQRYPGARVPELHIQRHADGGGVIEYRSDRPFAELAAGMLQGCLAHFGDRLSLEAEIAEAASRARFQLTPLTGEALQ